MDMKLSSSVKGHFKFLNGHLTAQVINENGRRILGGFSIDSVVSIMRASG
jgi:hypothetical protein